MIDVSFHPKQLRSFDKNWRNTNLFHTRQDLFQGDLFQEDPFREDLFWEDLTKLVSGVDLKRLRELSLVPG